MILPRRQQLPSAVLDTCVLWPSLERDFLLSLAIENLYRPLWSSAILAELEEHEARKLASRGAHPSDAAARARFLVEMMQSAFDDALVEGWEAIEGTFELPDRDDEHVVAAAKTASATMIVTANVRDYPANRMPVGIEVLQPAFFAARIVALSPQRALRAVESMSARYVRPEISVTELLDLLEIRYSMNEAVQLLRDV